MNIDSTSRQHEEPGLFAMWLRTYRGHLGHWAWLATLIILALLAAAIWCGWRFFAATTAIGKSHWGLLALAAIQAIAFLKMWFFMEMQRESILGEIRRVAAMDRPKQDHGR